MMAASMRLSCDQPSERVAVSWKRRPAMLTITRLLVDRSRLRRTWNCRRISRFGQKPMVAKDLRSALPVISSDSAIA